MPVLYGVFLFMGTSSLKGIQLVQRVLIMFMPAKYQPDYVYLRHVPLGRCHLFTFVQVLCLAALWTIKSIPSISIIFPLMVRSALTSLSRHIHVRSSVSVVRVAGVGDVLRAQTPRLRLLASRAALVGRYSA